MLWLLADVVLFLGTLVIVVTLTHRAMMREAQAREAQEEALAISGAVAPAVAAEARGTVAA